MYLISFSFSGVCPTSTSATAMNAMVVGCHNAGIQIYALYAVSDATVSESTYANYTVMYNALCTTSQSQR